MNLSKFKKYSLLFFYLYIINISFGYANNNSTLISRNLLDLKVSAHDLDNRIGFHATEKSESSNPAILVQENNVSQDKESDTLYSLSKEIKKNPNNPDLYARLSEVYSARNQPLLALRAIRKAVELDPTNIEYLNTQGEIASWVDNLPIMKESYSRILKLQPNNLDAYLGLARAYSRSNEYNEASLYYEAYLKKFPTDPDVQLEYAQVKIWQDDYEAANQILEKYKRDHGETSKYLKLKSELKKPPPTTTIETVSTLQEAIKKNPTNPDLYVQLSDAYSAAEQPKLALRAINHAVLLDPTNIEYLQKRGSIASWADNVPVMKESYLFILKLEPNNLDARLGLARAYSRENDYKKAAENYQIFLKEYPKDPNALLEYAQVKIWQSDYKNARHILAKYKQYYGETKNYLKLKSELKKGIQVSSEDEGDTIPSLKAEIKRHPNKADLYFRLSELYSDQKKPKLAFVAISKAVDLEPNNIRYLKAKGNIAYWLDDYPSMAQTYEHILHLNPNDLDAILGIARSYYQLGRLYTSGKYFHKYLLYRLKNKSAWLEYVLVENEQENYRKSMYLLTEYKKLFGVTKDYLAYKARVYAEAGWFISALNINTPLLQKHPNKYFYLVTQATAYRNGYQPGKAVALSKKIYKIQPDSAETKFLIPYVFTPIRSTISAGGAYLFDSQTVNISHAFANANFFLNPRTYIILDGLQENASATIGSGLAPVTGGTSTFDTSGSAGIFHQFNPYFAIRATGGALHIKDRNNFFIYDVGGYFNLGEKVSFSYRHSRNLYRPDLFIVFSPRAISLQILQEANIFNLFTQPVLDTYVNLTGYYTNLSDGNRFWEFIASPSTSVLRINGWKLDVGANADLLSFKERLDNGYYSPLFAQLYLGTLDLYYSKGFNTGFSLFAALGSVRDETFNFHLAADLAAELTFGIYSNWQLILRANYSYRGNPTDPYFDTYFGAVLTRRL